MICTALMASAPQPSAKINNDVEGFVLLGFLALIFVAAFWTGIQLGKKR